MAMRLRHSSSSSAATMVFCAMVNATIAFTILLMRGPAFAAESNPVIVGKARFTVISPQCIRMEYDENGRFADEPSLFAINRRTRFSGFRVLTWAGRTGIDTGEMKLVYAPDGKPFSPANLKVLIARAT